MIMIRYALSKTSEDSFPILFRPDCERTFFDPRTGLDRSLLEVKENLNKNGYDLFESLEEFLLEKAKRKKEGYNSL